jgi:PleD family two-component response regulator
VSIESPRRKNWVKAMSRDKIIKAKILVVDDEQGARDALQVILEDDYEVTTAVSGHEAITYCEAFE